MFAFFISYNKLCKRYGNKKRNNKVIATLIVITRRHHSGFPYLSSRWIFWFSPAFAIGIDKCVQTNQSLPKFIETLFQNTWFEGSGEHRSPVSVTIISFSMVLSSCSGISLSIFRRETQAIFFWPSAALSALLKMEAWDQRDKHHWGKG